MEAALLQNYLVVGAMLFGIGLVGFLSRRNMIVMFLSAEMMLQGTALTLVAFGRYHGNWTGQVFTIVILTVAASEAAIALALVLVLFNRRGSLDVTLWQDLREGNQPPFVDLEVPDEAIPQPQWPKLTPSGLEPPAPQEDVVYRTHV
jgi:NADH-quinone oxidoreductase subunit K